MRLLPIFHVDMMKLMLLAGLFLGLANQSNNAMDVTIACTDGKSFKVALADAKQFGVFKEQLENQENGLGILVVNQRRRSSDVIGALFQLLSGMPVSHFNDNLLENVFAAAQKLKAPDHIMRTLESELCFWRRFNQWHANYLRVPQEEQLCAIGLPYVQSHIMGNKLDLHKKEIKSIIGCLLSPRQIERISEVDLNRNELSLRGLDALKSLAPFARLTKLNLSNNHLDRLPAHFFVNIPTCVVISLANNQIRCIESGALAGARQCSINLCQNPIETVQPDAMTVGLNSVYILCSIGLQKQVINAMAEQLGAEDLRARLLLKCYELAHKLSNREGYMPYIVLAVMTIVCNSFMLPIAIMHQIDPLSFPNICIAVFSSLSAFKLFYCIWGMIGKTCYDSVANSHNKLTLVQQRDEKQVQQEMFES